MTQAWSWFKMSFKCPHSANISDEEAEALNWLMETLAKIQLKGSSHRNFERAVHAASALVKLGRYKEDAHLRLHIMSELIPRDTDLDTLVNDAIGANADPENMN